MAKFKATTEATTISKQILSIQKRGAAWQEDVQTCAVNIVQHVFIHHEVSLLNNLIAAMPKGAKVNALREFFEMTAKAEYSTDDACFLPSRDNSYILPEEYPIWYDFKPEPEFKPFDLTAEIAKLLKKALKRDEQDFDADTIDADTLTALSTLITVE